jgi:hypothetical protein
MARTAAFALILPLQALRAEAHPGAPCGNGGQYDTSTAKHHCPRSAKPIRDVNVGPDRSSPNYSTAEFLVASSDGRAPQ